MKYPAVFLFILFYLIADRAHGQGDRPGLRPAIDKFTPYLVEIKTKEKISTGFFSTVRVIDARPDTARMAIVSVDADLTPVKMVFLPGTEFYLAKCLSNKVFSNGKKDSLVMVLRDLWLSQSRSEAGWLEAQVMGKDKLQSNLFINADLYLGNAETYTYVGHIDTVFTGKGWLVNACSKLMTRSMESVLAEANKLCFLRDTMSKTFTIAEIKVRADWRKKYPVLAATRFKKGVFHSFDDFVSNRADTTVLFEVKEEIFRKILTRYKADGNTTLQKAWGFSDGESVFMHLDSTFYKMELYNGTFDLVAPEFFEIFNTIGNKVMASVGQYFLLDNPFKMLAFLPFLNPAAEKHLGFQLYHLNMTNGRLR